MQTLSFETLSRELEAAGAAPSVIARIISELEDHYADAELAALESGASPEEARHQAQSCLGSSEAIVAAVAAQPQLLDWRQRWPQSARCLDSVSYCLALPAATFVYCASHPAFFVRWGLSSSLAVCVTGSILFAMQWFMLFGT